jgi:hypothetical protein
MTRLLSILILSLSLLSLEAADVNITNVTHATSIASTDWLLGLTNGAGGDSRLIPTSLFPLLSDNNTFAGSLTATAVTASGNIRSTGGNLRGSTLTVDNTGAINGLTANRAVLTDVTKTLVSAAASGAVPMNADGSATTAAQISALHLATNVILSVTLNGAGATVPTGQVYANPVAGDNWTISGWAITAQGNAPTATFDVWKIAKGTSLPTVANTIMGTKPSLASGNALVSTTLTGWSTAVSAGDIWGVNLDSVAGATNITFQLFGYK